MNYSCCYVLTDNEKLHFYDQMMISLSSLRYTGFNGNVYIVTDNETAFLLEPKCIELNELSAELVIIQVEGNYTAKEKSRYLKTSLREYIQGDALYIDTDTLFVSPLPEKISDYDFAMVYTRNGLDDQRSYLWHKIFFDKCGFKLQEEDSKFYNAGVIWMRDTESVHDAFSQWHSLWKKENQIHSIVMDQLSLNYLWKNHIITIQELDNRFNVQIGSDYFSPSMLYKACIIHYYNNKVEDQIIFMLQDSELQKLNYRDKQIQQMIHDPFAAFSDCRWIKKDSKMDKYYKTTANLYKKSNGLINEYLKTTTFSCSFNLYMKHRRLFSICEKFYYMLNKCIRLFAKKKHI